MSQRHPSKRKAGLLELSTDDDECNMQVLLFFIENLIPFDCVHSPSFFNLFRAFKKTTYSLPEPEALLQLAGKLFNEYQEYFKAYFDRRPGISFSATCHSFNVSGRFEPYMLMGAHYVDEKFRLCEIPLGFFNYNTEEMPKLIVRNMLMNDFKDKLKFVTTNYQFQPKSLEIFKFLVKEDAVIDDKILPCIPSYLNGVVAHALNRLRKLLKLKHVMDINANSTHSTKNVIPLLVASFLDRKYTDFQQLPVAHLTAAENDVNREYLDILLSEHDSNNAASCLRYLNSCLFYRRQLPGHIEDSDWELVEFCVNFTRVFYEVVVYCQDETDVTSHMILKWMKVLIIRLSEFAKTLDNYGSLQPKVTEIVGEVILEVSNFHTRVEGKYDLILSSYLHPSTKRYLRDEHVSKIVSNVNKMAHENTQVNGQSSDIEDMILQTFNCSRNSTECYTYESSAGADVLYTSQNNFLLKETGPFILNFWRKFYWRYPTLSKLAKSSLSIQLCSDQKYDFFKKKLVQLSESIHGSYQSPCDLQVLFFLNRLSVQFDLSRFDPNNHDLDIQDFRLDYDDDTDLANQEASFESGEVAIPDFKRSRRKN